MPKVATVMVSRAFHTAKKCVLVESRQTQPLQKPYCLHLYMRMLILFLHNRRQTMSSKSQLRQLSDDNSHHGCKSEQSYLNVDKGVQFSVVQREDTWKGKG